MDEDVFWIGMISKKKGEEDSRFERGYKQYSCYCIYERNNSYSMHVGNMPVGHFCVNVHCEEYCNKNLKELLTKARLTYSTKFCYERTDHSFEAGLTSSHIYLKDCLIQNKVRTYVVFWLWNSMTGRCRHWLIFILKLGKNVEEKTDVLKKGSRFPFLNPAIIWPVDFPLL